MPVTETNSTVTKTCHWCGNSHLGLKCPYVKAIEYYESGSVKRVEFMMQTDISAVDPGRLTVGEPFAGLPEKYQPSTLRY